METRASIRVLLVDDHPLVRQTLTTEGWLCEQMKAAAFM